MIRNIILCVLISLLVNIPNIVQAQEQAQEFEDSTQLKVLSWNIYMLPPLVLFTGKQKRARAIGQLLMDSDYDVIVFQEAFHHGARWRIKHWLKDTYPYQIGPADMHYVSLRTNSGIWIVSKIPIKKVESVCFRKRWGFDNKMARKGALMVEGKKNGHTFQIVGTHLNSGGPADIRLSQVEAIQKELLEPHQKADVPQIICGDFNIKKGTDTYRKTLRMLEAQDGNLRGELKHTFDNSNDMNKHGGDSSIIDFIFYRENGCRTKSVERRIPKIQHRWHKRHKDLADHNPIETVITW